MEKYGVETGSDNMWIFNLVAKDETSDPFHNQRRVQRYVGISGLIDFIQMYMEDTSRGPIKDTLIKDLGQLIRVCHFNIDIDSVSL